MDVEAERPSSEESYPSQFNPTHSVARELYSLLDKRDRFVSFVEGRFTGKVAVHFLRALQQEVGKKLMIVLDNAPYFIAKFPKKQAVGAACFLNICRPCVFS